MFVTNFGVADAEVETISTVLNIRDFMLLEVGEYSGQIFSK